VLREFARQVGHQRQVVADLAPAAAGQQGDDRPAVEPVPAAELVGRGERGAPGLDGVYERVAFENRFDAVPGEVAAFEGEDDEQPVDIAADGLHAPLAPCPDLRGDVIEGADAVLFGPARHLYVEAGVVDQDQHVGGECRDVGPAFAHLPFDRPQVFQHLHDAEE